MLIKNSNIGIKDGFIEFVNASDKELELFEADKIINGSHKLAMPGLVNAHTHCAMTLLRNYADDIPLKGWLFDRIFPVEAGLSSDDIYWGTLLGIMEMIRSGTTAFADMYLHMDSVARAVIETGIRANLSRNPVKFTEENKCGFRDDSEGCFEYFRTWNGQAGGRIRVYIEVHSVYLFDEASLKNAAELASNCKTGIHIHLLETRGEREECVSKYGIDPAELCYKCGIFDLPTIAAHCVHLSERDIEILKEKNVNVVHNPTSNLKLGSGIARIPCMTERGIRVALGTDGAASNNNLNMFEEMHIAALIHKGVNQDPGLLSAGQVVEMATVNGAAAIGFGNEIGCIKKGMKADIVILDMDKPHYYPLNDPIAALVYSSQAADVDTVIVDGSILMEKQEMKTIDEELVKFKVKEIGKRLWR